MNPGLDFWSFRHDLKIPNSPKSSSCGVGNRHSDEKTLRGPDRVMTNPRSIKETRVARREKERPAQAQAEAERRSTITTDWSPIAR